MKNKSLFRSFGVCLLEHAAVCAFIALLTSFLLDSHDLSRPIVLVCLALLTAAGAFWFGIGIRTGQEETSTCWNAAIFYYLADLGALMLVWKCNTLGAYGDLRPSDVFGLVGQIWCIPSLAPLAAIEREFGIQNIFYLITGTVMATIEPLCLTLGLLYGRKSTNEEKEANA